MTRIDAKATLARAQRAEEERDAAIAHCQTLIVEKVALEDELRRLRAHFSDLTRPEAAWCVS
ncbi:hypothetical protein OE699_01825 [Sedimentimonas flavescens]|uniref:Transposase n=1 Tax=Sedimentimonas flavescens TaxID=2851012 RepID=A0ABT2ZVE9_9RHOB|nr:hypothetical protein [Sedimentimonas flavescens]MCV2877577.1 hypothetical protein [Sedimentimonas flavescens]